MLITDTPTALEPPTSQPSELTNVDFKTPPYKLRATSEPPPDHDEQQDGPSLQALPVQEYSWEWGAFPQPSPMKNTFGMGRFDSIKGKGKARLESLESEDDLDLAIGIDEELSELGLIRSQSVPPDLDGSPAMKRRELPVQDIQLEGSAYDPGTFGAGGRLTSSRQNPTQFRVYIEGKTVTFELSIVDSDESKGGHNKVFDGRDEVEAASLFEKGKVDYRRFVDDENVVHDTRLVIKWAGGQ